MKQPKQMKKFGSLNESKKYSYYIKHVYVNKIYLTNMTVLSKFIPVIQSFLYN